MCSFEAEATVNPARDAYMLFVSFLGFKLDVETSLGPCSTLLYLGLHMIMPSRIPHEYRSFSLPILVQCFDHIAPIEIEATRQSLKIVERMEQLVALHYGCIVAIKSV